jgi:hypothetical protein
MEIKGMGSKEQQAPTSERLHPHLSGSMGIESKRGRRVESAPLWPTRHGMDEGWKKEDMIP